MKHLAKRSPRLKTVSENNTISTKACGRKQVRRPLKKAVKSMYKGIAGSSGYGIGKAVIFKEADLSFEHKKDCDPQSEKARFDKAVDAFTKHNEQLRERITAAAGEKQGEIITGHIMMLKDPFFCGEIEKLITAGNCAEAAVCDICDMFITMFSSVDDEMTRQRAADVKDVKAELLALLLGVKAVDLSVLEKGSVLVTAELTPSMTACIDRENIVAVVTEEGSMTSHAAILARAMEIPAVLSVQGATRLIKDGEQIIVDGSSGEVIPSPDEATSDEYRRKKQEYALSVKALEAYRGKPTATRDGIKLELVSNIGTPDETSKVIDNDSEGVGLFRTEFLFMDRKSAPTEDEQFAAYKKVAEALNGKPVIIRTLDIGGDKAIDCLGLEKEENPFLGYRAIRYCLGHKELFKTQLRALLRAAAFGDIRIMLPLITGVDELRAAKKLISEAAAELERDGKEHRADVSVGVMIETPAAVMNADMLAEEADFFSIGTNDLTGYTMAVDRGNANVAYLYSALSPAVLRAIKHVVKAARAACSPVGMCGEAAADKRLIPLLISFGLNEFSVSPVSTLRTRSEIARWSKADADALAERIMKLKTESEIAAALAEATE